MDTSFEDSRIGQWLSTVDSSNMSVVDRMIFDINRRIINEKQQELDSMPSQQITKGDGRVFNRLQNDTTRREDIQSRLAYIKQLEQQQSCISAPRIQPKERSDALFTRLNKDAKERFDVSQRMQELKQLEETQALQSMQLSKKVSAAKAAEISDRLSKEANRRNMLSEARRLQKEEKENREVKENANRLHKKPHDQKTFERLTSAKKPAEPVEEAPVLRETRQFTREEAMRSGERLTSSRSVRPIRANSVAPRPETASPKLNSSQLAQSVSRLYNGSKISEQKVTKCSFPTGLQQVKTKSRKFSKVESRHLKPRSKTPMPETDPSIKPFKARPVPKSHHYGAPVPQPRPVSPMQMPEKPRQTESSPQFKLNLPKEITPCASSDRQSRKITAKKHTSDTSSTQTTDRSQPSKRQPSSRACRPVPSIIEMVSKATSPLATMITTEAQTSPKNGLTARSAAGAATKRTLEIEIDEDILETRPLSVRQELPPKPVMAETPQEIGISVMETEETQESEWPMTSELVTPQSLALDVSFENRFGDSVFKGNGTMDSRLAIPSSREPMSYRFLDQENPLQSPSELNCTERFETGMLQSILQSSDTLHLSNFDDKQIPQPLYDLNISDIAHSPKKENKPKVPKLELNKGTQQQAKNLDSTPVMAELKQPPSLTLRLPASEVEDNSLASQVVKSLRQGTERRDQDTQLKIESVTNIEQPPKLDNIFKSAGLQQLSSRRSMIKSPKFSEETKFLLEQPKSFLEDTLSPKANFSAILDSYRFVVGLDDADELIYEDKPFDTSINDSFVGRGTPTQSNKTFS